MRSSILSLWLPFTTIIYSICVACSTPTVPNIPKVGVFAPAKIAEPFLPDAKRIHPTKASSLTLEELLVYADTHAPVIQTARARVGLADADIADASPTFPTNPQVSVSMGARTFRGSAGFDFEVAVQQQLEIASEPTLRRRAASDQKELTHAIVNEVRWAVHVETHSLFVELLLARERVAQALHFVKFSRSMRDIAAHQVDAGEASPLTRLVADADYAQTREQIVIAKQRVNTLTLQIAALVGWPTKTLPPLHGSLPELRKAPNIDALLALMVKHHPSLRTRELAVQASTSRLVLERREGWLEPTLGFSYGQESAPGPEDTAQLWMLSVGIPIPLWRINQGEKARARAEVKIADRARNAKIVRLRSELSQTVVALNASAERITLFEEEVVPQLEKNLNLLQRAYALGEVDIHQVSQTRERLLNATAKYIDARVSYYKIAATLEGLVGTEIWSKSEGQHE